LHRSNKSALRPNNWHGFGLSEEMEVQWNGGPRL